MLQSVSADDLEQILRPLELDGAAQALFHAGSRLHSSVSAVKG